MSSFPKPLGAEVVLTHRCNHHCIHCYDPSARAPDPIGADYKARCERILDQMHDSGIRKAILTGGEPLLVPDLLEAMLAGAFRRGIEPSVNSNLSLMDSATAKMLKSFDRPPFILTSLPSVDPAGCDRITGVPGSYGRIIRGISICEEEGLGVGVNIVASGYSSYDFDSLDDLLSKHPNIGYLAISPVIPQCCRIDDDRLYLDASEYVTIDGILKHVSDVHGINVGSTTPMPLCLTGYDHRTRDFHSMCSAGRIQCVIDYATGDVTACAHSSRPYGNIYEEGLLDAWARMGEWRDSTLLSKECSRCPSLSACGGECRMMTPLCNKKYALDSSYVATIPASPPLDPDSLFVLSDRLVMRDDGDVGALLIDNHGYMMVRKPVMDLLSLLRELGEFKLADLDGKVVMDDYFNRCFRYLVDTGIIVVAETRLLPDI